MMGGGIFAADDVESRPYQIIPEPAKVNTSAGVCSSPKILKQAADKSLGPEGYKITIKPQGVEIQAGDRAGLFYAKTRWNSSRPNTRTVASPAASLKTSPGLDGAA